MKRLYLVEDMPRYAEGINYSYIVKAETEGDAINIVIQKTQHHNWDWEAKLMDNTEVWE